MNATTECLYNIKMIKLYSWIDIFTKMIEEKRKSEVWVLFWKMFLSGLWMGCINFFPMLIQTVSIGSFIGSGKTIDLETTYTVIAIFNIVNGPINQLPNFLG